MLSLTSDAQNSATRTFEQHSVLLDDHCLSIYSVHEHHISYLNLNNVNIVSI